MVMRRLTRPALCLGAALALAACEEGDLPAFLAAPADAGGGDAAAGTTRAGSTTVERDVEAPDVFQVTEAGLWDGRPSLGGVWVAHPDVKEPERVLIRNEANDKFVIGALFRRERDNPGPRLQVSSDAADALGMLAGQPVRLNVTALRREEVAAEPDEPAPAPAPEDPAAEPGPEAAPEPAPAPQPAQAEPVIRPAASEDAAAGDAAPDAPAPARKGFFATLFAPKPKSSETAEPLDATSATLGEPPAVETAPLDEAQAAQAAPAPRPASSLAKPYIQIGIFSVEQNARNAATSLRRDGILPTVRKQSSSGKTFWRVLVGPSTSASERAAILRKVKALGYTDAYFVTN